MMFFVETRCEGCGEFWATQALGKHVVTEDLT